MDKIPPLAHAVGGSVGSALALLLLYPLERGALSGRDMMDHRSSCCVVGVINKIVRRPLTSSCSSLRSMLPLDS